jgi:succinate-acetate transporter protein
MMSKKPQVGRQLKARLFLGVCFLILLAASLIKGEFVLAATGAIGVVWALESYRWYSKGRSNEQG